MPATLTGTVFNDLNHNGVINAGEPGIPNVFVVLFSNVAGICTSTVTDANGVYSFTVAAAGTYTVYEPVADPGSACPPAVFIQPPGFTLSNGPRKLAVTVTGAQVTGNATIAGLNFSHDTINNPLLCTTSMIQFSMRPTIWSDINIVTGESSPLGTLNPPLEVNAIGYNTTDHYIYGYDQLTDRIVRVDNGRNAITLSPLPTGLPAANYTTGTFDLNGFYYLFENHAARFFVIDLRPNSPTFMKLVNPANGFQEQTSNFGVTLSRALSVSDWVFEPADGNLYGITDEGMMQRIVPTTGAIADITTTPHNTGPFGAVAIDSNGMIFAISNRDGGIYRYTLSGNTATAIRFSTTLTTSFNDGTMCPLEDIEVDFGDAPDIAAGNGTGNYSTTLANDGPRHQLLNALFLGTTVTAEKDALQNSTATGDDIPRGIQDDGLAVPLPGLVAGTTAYSLNVTVTNQTGSAANLYGWIDFNTDGVFQGNEAAPVVAVPSQPGVQTVPLVFTVPAAIEPTAAETFVRLRLTTNVLANQNSSPTEADTRSLGPASDGEVEDYSLPLIGFASLGLTKQVSPTAALPGEVVQYTFTVHNPNPFDLANVRITDSTLGLIDELSVLAAGATLALTVEFTIPENAPADSIISNIATVTSDQTLPATATAEVTVLPRFSMTIAKTPDSFAVQPGGTVNYTITVTNTSNGVPLTGVNIVDDLLEVSFVIDTLGPGESETFVASFTVPPGTPSGTVFANQATATSTETGPVSDTADVVVSPLFDIFMTKKVNPPRVRPGETVVYTLTVTNAGNDTLTNVRIVDPTLGIDYTVASLIAGESDIIEVPFVIPLTASQGDTIDNVAAVTSDQTEPEEANAVVTVLGSPAISLLKSVTPEQASPGDSVNYTFTVTNTGNTILSNIVISDPLLGLNRPLNPLGPGQSQTILLPFVIPALATSPFINIATVTGSFESQAVTDSDQAAVTIQPLQPAFTVTKTVDQAFANPGDTVNFTFTITNTGNVPLTHIAITDSLLSYTSAIDRLAPGASATETLPFTIPASAAPGTNFVNVVTVTPSEAPAQEGTAVTTVNAIAALTLTKTASASHASPGDTVNYLITVTNTGNVDLTNVSVNDELLGLNANIPILAVGQSQSFTPAFTIPVTTPDGTTIVNTAHAASDQTDSTQASAVVLVDPLPPALTVAKTASAAVAAPGDVITYTVTVQNTGATILTNVIITDGLLGIVQPVGTLTPGQIQSFSFPFTVPADAPNGSVIVNTTVAVSDQTNPVEDGSSVTVDPVPALQIVKTIAPAQAAPGETVTATIQVTNTGNITLTNLEVTDPTLHFHTPVASLPPGAVLTFSIPFLTPQVSAGTVIINTATATSTETGPSASSAELAVLPNFALSLFKTVNPSTALPGDTVTFTIEARNTSNADLTTLHFTDDFLGIDEVVDHVPAGFSTLFSRTYTIPADARAGGAFVNTVTVTSVQTPPLSASAQVTIGADPRLQLFKTASSPAAFPGETIFFRLEGVNVGNVPLTNVRYSDPLLGYESIAALQDPGAVVSVIIPFTVPADAAPGTTIVNTLTSASDQTGHQSASVSVDVIAPLTIRKSADAEFIFVGDLIHFELLVTNTGSTTATNIVINDVLQKGTEFVSGSVRVNWVTEPAIQLSDGIAIGDLAPGQSTEVVFRAIQRVMPPNDRVRNQAFAAFRRSGSPNRFTVESNIVIIEIEEHFE